MTWVGGTLAIDIGEAKNLLKYMYPLKNSRHRQELFLFIFNSGIFTFDTKMNMTVLFVSSFL